MKCPHCGIHYMDGERECPLCGKRPGLLAPKKKSKFNSADVEQEYRPSPKKAKPATSTERKQTYNHKKPASTEAAWQRAAAGAHSHDNPLAASPRQQKNKASGCLVVVILFIIFIAASCIFGIMSYNDVAHSATDWLDDTFLSDDYDDSDDIYESCDPYEAFSSGTWVNEDYSLTMVVDDSGTISWSDGTKSAVDDYPLFQRLALTEDNASDYCSDDELEEYPIDEYTQYTLWASTWNDETDDSDSLSICLYMPNDVDAADVTSFDYYDYDAGEYHTFTYLSDATALPDSVIAGQTSQSA
ncbi:MAG: hypothetical protein Q4P20_01960 [Eubacteriales bacterium]|nr:hypothetical protein [Eubacteriales bacterium]